MWQTKKAKTNKQKTHKSSQQKNQCGLRQISEQVLKRQTNEDLSQKVELSNYYQLHQNQGRLRWVP